LLVFAIVSALFGALVATFRPRASLVVEILVLGQQLAVLKRARPACPGSFRVRFHAAAL
jgi:hypothetical protein